MSEKTDEELMADLAHGESAAFEILVRRHLQRAVGYAFSIVRDHHAAQDVAQNAFLQLYQGSARFDQKMTFLPWFLAIVRARGIDFLRRQKRYVPFDEDLERSPEPVSQDPLEFASSEELRQALHRRLESLPLHYQEALYLRYFQGLTLGDIGKVMGKSSKAVDQYIRLALEKLRRP